MSSRGEILAKVILGLHKRRAASKEKLKFDSYIE